MANQHMHTILAQQRETIKGAHTDKFTTRLRVSPAPGRAATLATIIRVGRSQRSVIDKIIQINLPFLVNPFDSVTLQCERSSIHSYT